MEKLLTRAIRERKKVIFLYEGSTRIVDPYYYGIIKKMEALLGYQTGGFKYFRKPGLEIYQCQKIYYAEILEIPYHVNDKFVPEVLKITRECAVLQGKLHSVPLMTNGQ